MVWNDKQWNALYTEAVEFPLLNDFKETLNWFCQEWLDIFEFFSKKDGPFKGHYSSPIIFSSRPKPKMGQKVFFPRNEFFLTSFYQLAADESCN